MQLTRLFAALSPAILVLAGRSRRSHKDIGPVHRHVFGGETNSTSTLAAREDTKYVFMHHIVGNTYPYGVSDWATDLAGIGAKPIDAVALNIGNDGWQRDRIRDAFAAAKGTNMKLFISFDYTAFECSVPKTLDYMTEFAAHPNYFRYQEKAMVSSYAGGIGCLDWWGWKQIQDAGYYLMPFLWSLEPYDSHPNLFQTDYSFLNSWLCWGCAWPQGNYAKNTDDDTWYKGLLGAGRYATTVSMWIFTHYPNWENKNFYLRGDDWLSASRWEQLVSMRESLTFVEMVTWNDWGESDYYGPFRNPQPDGTYWAEKFPHTAFYDMSDYYIKAFKTGTYPAVIKDVIYYWSRPHSKNSVATNDTLGKPSGWDWTSDNLWAVVFATASCDVTLTIGSSSQTFSIPAGVNKLKIPLSSGSISVKMVRASQTIISQSPTDFTYTSRSVEKYNFNVYANSATATGAVTPTSTSASTVAPTATSVASTWASQGCRKDASSARVLRDVYVVDYSMTTASCIDYCSAKGYTMAGTEYSHECICGKTMYTSGGAGTLVTDSECSSTCAGDSSKKCGGDLRVNLYTAPGTTVQNSVASTWTSQGCRKDVSSARMLRDVYVVDYSMTTGSCIDYCSAAGYTMAGTEYAHECTCGKTMYTDQGAGTLVSDSDCSSKCQGDSSEYCGGDLRANIYTAPGTTIDSVASTWTSQGCRKDVSSARMLRDVYLVDYSMTTASCINYCSAKGYTMAGTEYAHECTCGKGMYTSGGAGTLVADSDCSSKCAGDSSASCGGDLRANLYTAPGTTVTNSVASTWTSRGCRKDVSSARMLRDVYMVDYSMTTASCIDYCSAAGYTMAGTEYAHECTCGKTMYTDQGAGTLVADSDCSSKCQGDSSAYCGGDLRANLYTAPGTTIW